jgi:hypothetical protein
MISVPVVTRYDPLAVLKSIKLLYELYFIKHQDLHDFSCLPTFQISALFQLYSSLITIYISALYSYLITNQVSTLIQFCRYLITIQISTLFQFYRYLVTIKKYSHCSDSIDTWLQSKNIHIVPIL